VPQLKIKIKGRGSMEIKVKYENVPHFCSTCGRMGHAAANCGQEAHDHEIIFGEDLSASPPKRTREIMIHQGPSRTVRPLFQKRDWPQDNRVGREEELRGKRARGGDGYVVQLAVCAW
jgi:hypothetical protein